MPETNDRLQAVLEGLPGLDCGICGFRTCAEFAKLVTETPDEIKRCTNIGTVTRAGARPGGPPAKIMPLPCGARGSQPASSTRAAPAVCGSAGAAAAPKSCAACDLSEMVEHPGWQDSLGREFDFILDTFPNEPGPRETILPHNPQLTKEMNITRGDIMIGRPLACRADARSRTAAW